MASSPARRMSWRRRRRYSAADMPVAARGMSVQALPVARAEHAVAMQQQGGHPREFLQLRQGRFVLVVLIDVLHLRARQPGQVLQDLVALVRQRRAGACGQAETTEETVAPVAQGLGTL